MGKEFKNIDELFRSEMTGPQTAAPSHVKANIDKALGFKKWKRGLFFIGLLLVLTGGGITAYLMSNDEGGLTNAQLTLNEPAPHSSSIAVEGSEQEAVSHELLSQNENTNNAATIANTNPDQTTNATSSPSSAIIPASTISNQSSQIDTDNSNSSHPINNNSNGGNNSSSIASSNSTQNNNNSSLDESENMNTALAVNLTQDNKEDNTTENNSLETSESNLLANSSNNEESATTNESANDTSSENEEKSNESDELENPEENVNIENESDLAEEPDENITPSEENNEGTEEDNSTSEEATSDESESNENEEENPTGLTSDELGDMPAESLTIIDPSKESSYKPITISVTSGINFVHSSYLSNDLPEKSLYNNSTDDRIGNQTNLSISYRLKNGLAFGTGLGLVNYNENYDFPTYGVKIDSTLNEELIYDTMGFIIDTNYYYTTNETQVEKRSKGTTKVSYLMLPVNFGTQIIWKKFQFDLFASARFNFLMRSSGAYLANNNVNGFHKENSIYKPFYVDIMLGGNLHYNLWKNIYLTGTVKYRPVVGQTLQTVSVNKSFDYIHLGMGLSLKF